MTEELDILVVDDTIRHQGSARELLLGHNLRIAGSYFEAVEMIQSKAPQVLMTDLYFPYGEGCPSGNRSDGYQPRPLGLSLALFASRVGNNVGDIAIYTDADHHSDAVSGTFDSFYSHFSRPDYRFDKTKEDKSICGRTLFRINDSNLIIFDERDIEPLYPTFEGLKTYDEVRSKGGEVDFKGYVKNWKEVLDLLSGL